MATEHSLLEIMEMITETYAMLTEKFKSDDITIMAIVFIPAVFILKAMLGITGVIWA